MDKRIEKIIIEVYGILYLDCLKKKQEGYRNHEIAKMYQFKSNARIGYILKTVEEFYNKLTIILK